MSAHRIVLRLARNPGTPFAEGDDHRGYTLVVPLADDGRIDPGAMKGRKASVRRFAPDSDPLDGRLRHHGSHFYFDYGEADDAEPLFKMGEHTFNLGDYVSITDEEGRLLTYKVTESTPV